jgi:glycosyltransferase involved in cell wall biosynthesis
VRTINRPQKIVVVYGVPAGAGGLGLQAASTIQSLSRLGIEIHALGPGRTERWPLSGSFPSVEWHRAPPSIALWRSRYTWLRWLTGRLQYESDRKIGRWAAREVRRIEPDVCYVFTQVGLETLKLARATDIPSIVDNPNGHIRNFRRVYEHETERLGGSRYVGHPTHAMVQRVETEYALADRIRVSSSWSMRSMQSYGIDGSRIGVFQQPINFSRFSPSERPIEASGPLRICFVGSLDLRKGFVYLLRAVKLIGRRNVKLEVVGATGDRFCRRLFMTESQGIDIRSKPGDPVPTYQRSELMVLPTLEDGQPFAVGEAMASGLPVIVTDSCGSADWIRPGQSGWVVPPANVEKLATAIEDALKRRSELSEMGSVARADTLARAGMNCDLPLRKWLSPCLST